MYPKKVKDGNEDEAIYRVSAPDANIGWDSDLGTYYLGYTFYNISYHNSKLGYDLPVYITLDKAIYTMLQHQSKPLHNCYA